MTTIDNSSVAGFSGLALSEPVHKALVDAKYETPTPIQALAIPPLLEGADIVGQAQTGTGKTAAFALPILSRIDMQRRETQVLVLAPTRELAIQVADGFKKYSKHMKGLNVLPIYGGQEYGIQLRGLRQGAHVVIGTPGRVMDHIRKGTLAIANLSCLILDEADEMLRMGFIDDVEWILEKTPDTRQTALFSATMPTQIRRIAKRHLNNPKEIIIETRTTAAVNIRQRYLVVPGAKKFDALARILEKEKTDGVIVFVKTKNATVEVADKLTDSGYSACALNGDLSQDLRERTVNRLKRGQLNIIVATDVAARGLDVERVSHVFNFDAPFDTETYVHRIGRTGRAGRSGEAIMFLSPVERRILRNISVSTKQDIEQIQIPSVKEINLARIQRFKDKIAETLESKDISFFKDLIETYYAENDIPQVDIAAAIAHLLQGDTPILLKEEPTTRRARPQTEFNRDRDDRARGDRSRNDRSRNDRSRNDRSRNDRSQNDRPQNDRPRRAPAQTEAGMETYRIEVGEAHGVKPGNIVGAIANEADLDSGHIGRINIFEDHSTIDLPAGMPGRTMKFLKTIWVCNAQLNISKVNGEKVTEVKANRVKTGVQKSTDQKSIPPRVENTDKTVHVKVPFTSDILEKKKKKKEKKKAKKNKLKKLAKAAKKKAPKKAQEKAA